jgi:hypothetical protein
MYGVRNLVFIESGRQDVSREASASLERPHGKNDSAYADTSQAFDTRPSWSSYLARGPKGSSWSSVERDRAKVRYFTRSRLDPGSRQET